MNNPVSPEQPDPTLGAMGGIRSPQDDPADDTSSMKVADLVSMMETASLQDFSLVLKIDRPTKMIQGFLEKHEPAFVRVMQFRQRVSTDSTLASDSRAVKLMPGRVGWRIRNRETNSLKGREKEPTRLMRRGPRSFTA